MPSLEFATLKVKDAVCDRFRDDAGKRPSVDKQRPDVRVHAYLTEREATIYLDTSGEPLFKRGWRRDTDAAPLRENLAAGLIALSGWTPGTPFLDPMCGSGTIAIEAAALAADRAPGLARTFGFQKLAWFDGPTWQRIRQRARDRVRKAPAVAGDLRERPRSASARSHAAATRRRQASRNGSRSSRATCSTRAAPAPAGVLLANPPYGVRLHDEHALAAFYPRLGDALKQRLRRLDRVLPHRRHAAREADRPQAVAPHAALERQHRVPPLSLRHRRRAGRVAAPAAPQ